MRDVIDGTYREKRSVAVKMTILFGGMTASLFVVAVTNAALFTNIDMSVLVLLISFFMLLATLTSGSYALLLELDRANTLREALKQESEDFDPDDLDDI